MNNNEWQPIETAPKDGTLIMLNEYGHTYIGWVDKNDGCHTTDGWLNPTHWMPLPKPPQE